MSGVGCGLAYAASCSPAGGQVGFRHGFGAGAGIYTPSTIAQDRFGHADAFRTASPPIDSLAMTCMVVDRLALGMDGARGSPLVVTPAANANRQGPNPAKGGLAPWQARRAEAMMLAGLSGGITLADLAKACRLSPSYFGRSFKQTFNCPPHRWLITQRIEHAKNLITSTCLPLCEIAICAGFSDQSHFTRAFSKHMRSSPAAWRRAQAA